MAAALVIILLLGILLATFARERAVGLFSPILLFTIANTIMGVGIVAQLDWSSGTDTRHGIAVALTAVLFLCGVIAGDALGPRQALPVQRVDDQTSPRLTLLVNLFSLAMVLIYFNMTGGVIVFKTISALLSGRFSALDTASLRFSYYAQDYTAPGLFNQFKNFLYPYSSAALLMYGLISKRRNLVILGGVSLLLAALFLIGTGQRTFLVMFAVGFLLLASQFRTQAKSIRPIVAFGIVLAVSLYLFSTFTLKRASGLDGMVTSAVSRVFEAQQRGSILAFRYMDSLPQRYGGEYLETLSSVLPSSRGSTFANEAFARAFGSMRGTMPYSLWGGLYLNFRWTGLIIGSFLIGLAWNRVHFAYLAGRRDPARCAAYAGMFACMGLWVAGGPMYLILNGALAGVAWLSAQAIWRANARPSPAPARVAGAGLQ